MNDQEQDIAVAKALGWKMHAIWKWEDPKGKIHENWAGLLACPRYGLDLNAMHEAETLSVVAQHLEMEYRETLGDVCGQYQITWHATAAQRREALLRTLNLYKP